MEKFHSEVEKGLESPGGPDISVSGIGNIYSRMMRFNRAGSKEHGHSHTFDHMTILATGALKVTVDGKSTDFKAPAMIYIQSGKVHELQATVDHTLAFCVHALRKEDDYTDIIDPSQLPEGISLTDTMSKSFPLDFDTVSQILRDNDLFTSQNQDASKEVGDNITGVHKGFN